MLFDPIEKQKVEIKEQREGKDWRAFIDLFDSRIEEVQTEAMFKVCLEQYIEAENNAILKLKELGFIDIPETSLDPTHLIKCVNHYFTLIDKNYSSYKFYESLISNLKKYPKLALAYAQHIIDEVLNGLDKRSG